MKHFISVTDLNREEIHSLLALARDLRLREYKVNKQVFTANLFFEPSTRTKTSFIVAERKLGLEPLEFQAEHSSMKKGETLYDTVKTFESIGASALVIRHQDDHWADALRSQTNVPMINAGAGKKDHPTQSLLDADTIYNEFGQFTGLNIVIAGDIKHSRVARSNAQMLKKLGANVFFSGAPQFMDESLGIPYVSMDDAVNISDVLMLLRIQHERHHSYSGETAHYLEEFGLTKKREEQMKKEAIIMHPGPVNRGVELETTLVESNRSRIFKQMENGVFVRMAVLLQQLLQWGIIHENDIEKRDANGIKQSTRKIRSVN